jgi:branched-chain amino acid transport system permease protein
MPFDLIHMMGAPVVGDVNTSVTAGQLLLQQIINGLVLGSVYALIALGYTMVYGVLRLINFAHGDVYMVGAYISYLIVNKAMDLGHGPSWILGAVALTASMIGCGVLGVAIERFAYRPVRRAPRLTPLITAIGVSLLLENLGVQPFVFGSSPRFCPATIPGDEIAFHFDGVTVARNSVILVAATLALLALLWYVVTKTKLGKAIRAVSFDQDAASLMGINTDRVISFTFFIGSALAGAGAFLFAALTHDQLLPYMGILPGVKAFVAAVLGGIGNIPGAALGGFIMGLAETMVKAYGPAAHIPASYADAAAFVILIVILLVRPSGLLGKGIVEKV